MSYQQIALLLGVATALGAVLVATDAPLWAFYAGGGCLVTVAVLLSAVGGDAEPHTTEDTSHEPPPVPNGGVRQGPRQRAGV